MTDTFVTGDVVSFNWNNTAAQMLPSSTTITYATNQSCPTPGAVVTCALTGRATGITPVANVSYTSTHDAIEVHAGVSSFIDPVFKQPDCANNTCIRDLTMFLPEMNTQGVLGDVKSPINHLGNHTSDVNVTARVVTLGPNNVIIAAEDFTLPASTHWATSSGHDFFSVLGVGNNKISAVTVEMPDGGFQNFRNAEISNVFTACTTCGDGIEPPPINEVPVPEPSSMALLGTGLLVFAQVLRRKLS